MEINESMLRIYEQLMDNISNQNNNQTSASSSVEEIAHDHVQENENRQNTEHIQCDLHSQHNNQNNQHHQHGQLNNQNNQIQQRVHNIVEIDNPQINNEPILLKIDKINTEINFPWKIQGLISCKHPKRTYNNVNGSGEISTWDLVDDTSSINLIAFNLNSNIMSHKLIEGRSYEFNSLSIRSVNNAYRTLSHEYQLMVTNTTGVREIPSLFNYQLTYNFTHLNNIEDLPLNSIIDVEVQVIRDYGVTAGNTNDTAWHRRELHIAQDGFHTRCILWNEQANRVQGSMVNMHIRLKNMKVSWYNGSRNIVSLGNTRLSVI